jgi:hypothetical protein
MMVPFDRQRRMKQTAQAKGLSLFGGLGEQP